MILILPVFLGIVFTIMEIGNVSFRLIVLNHATYEVARVGGMTWGLSPSGNQTQLSLLMKQILPDAIVACGYSDQYPPLHDPQADQDNKTLVCTGKEDVKLMFPISSIMLAKPAGSGTRHLEATVPMPIEQPLAQ